MKLKAHLGYAKYLARHKWFVFVAGLEIGAPFWRLVIHDWSKFLPCEWRPYVEEFYGAWRTRAEKYVADELVHFRFDVAWLHHQHLNPHHWQHWVLREDDGQTKYLEMPEHFAREMVADWCGAGRAITGKWEVWKWYAQNYERILLHPLTRQLVDSLIAIEQGEMELHIQKKKAQP
jgi:hypothetical protein